MQALRILQAAVLMMVVSLAASCAAGKEYAGKLFPKNDTTVKNPQTLAMRFLETDNMHSWDENWVSTDIIMGRDTNNNTALLDSFSKIFPATVAAGPATDTSLVKHVASNTEKKVDPGEEVVAKTHRTHEVRNRKIRGN